MAESTRVSFRRRSTTIDRPDICRDLPSLRMSDTEFSSAAKMMRPGTHFTTHGLSNGTMSEGALLVTPSHELCEISSPIISRTVKTPSGITLSHLTLPEFTNAKSVL